MAMHRSVRRIGIIKDKPVKDRSIDIPQ